MFLPIKNEGFFIVTPAIFSRKIAFFGRQVRTYQTPQNAYYLATLNRNLNPGLKDE